MNNDAQILVARLLTHQTLRRDDRSVRRVLSDDVFRAEVDSALAGCGMKLLDNVYADHVTLALKRDVEPKIFGAKESWQNNNFGLARDGVALLVVLWAQIILPKRERQEAHQHVAQDQSDMFGKEKPLPRAEDSSMGISYKALLADFGEKLGKKTRMDMNLGLLTRVGFIERRGDLILEGPLLDLMMDTDSLKERIINGALAEVFKAKPLTIDLAQMPADRLQAAIAEAADTTEPMAELAADSAPEIALESTAESVAEAVAKAVAEASTTPSSPQLPTE